MDNKKLLIVGIDPGTTTAYSIIDLEGHIIKLHSAKNLGINNLISNISKEGKVIFVGTDKAKVPKLVNNFATKLGSKLIQPKEDLKVLEKKSLITDHITNNDHQSDALAASLFAYNKIKEKIKRIDFYLKEKNKLKIKNKVSELVLLNGIYLRNAIDIIEKPEKEEIKIINKVIHKKIFNKEDYIKLYNKFKLYEREISFLKKHNTKLKNKIKNTEINYYDLIKIKNKLNYDEKAKKLISQKEKRILSFDKELQTKINQLDILNRDFKELNMFLMNLNDYFIVKKLKNLGNIEFNQKKAFIKKDDILLVEEPNVISQKTIDSIRDKVKIILHKNPLNNSISKNLNLVFINIININYFETKYLAFIKKDLIEKELSKVNLVNKVITEYKIEKKLVF